MPLATPFVRTCALCLCFFGLTGCDTPPTQVDQYFGLSVKQAQHQQTQNLPIDACPLRSQHPACHHKGQGSGHPFTQEGHRTTRDSDGESAQSAIQRYQDSFAAPLATTPGPNLGTGSAFKR